MKKYFVVSDVFRNSADNQKVLTFCDVFSKIAMNALDNCELLLEQGISEEQTDCLRNLVKNESKSIIITSYFDQYVRCSGKLTHKHKTFNTLISEPVASVDANEFEAVLLIDARCAELSDHVTGKHLQLMLLIEAARQMVNAVTEKFFSDTSMTSMSYLTNHLEIQCNAFVYPFFTKIIYRVLNSKIKMDGNGKMKIIVDFIQDNTVKSSVIFSFMILENKFVTSIEENAIAHKDENRG